MQKLKVLELFAGIGACSRALERLNIPHEIVDAVEIDKYAVQAFNAVHGTNFEPQDITKWDKELEVDLIMHGSPCQDFSIAGKQAGGDQNSGTRSSLMYETLRIVEKLKPKYVIWENVKNLLSEKHRHNFDAYIEAMAELGYDSRYKVLNAKDYGVPQNRERVFTISVLGENTFEFPEPVVLEKYLIDILEPEVEEKYFLNDEQTKNLVVKPSEDISKTVRSSGRASLDRHTWDLVKTPDVSYCLDANYYKGTTLEQYLEKKRRQVVRVGGIYDKGDRKHQAGSVYDPSGIAATLSTMQGGNQEPIIVASRGRGEHNEQHLEPRKDNLTNTITSVQKDNYVAEPKNALDGYRIRKLTPRECWRLMAFDDAAFDRAKATGLSNTQLYKQAGNSIVVSVLEAIFKNLFEE